MPGYLRWGASLGALLFAVLAWLLALGAGRLLGRLPGLLAGLLVFFSGTALLLRWLQGRLAAWQRTPYGRAARLYHAFAGEYGEACEALATRLRYLGGHPDLPGPIDDVYLYLLKSHLVVAYPAGRGAAGASLPRAWLESIQVDGREVRIGAREGIVLRLETEAPEEVRLLADRALAGR